MTGAQTPVRAAIGLGANLGDSRGAVADAIAALRSLPSSRCMAVSRLYRTAPVDAPGPDFINAVVLLETTLPAPALLVHLQAIEREHGRERPFRNAPRTLDLDLLLYGSACIDEPGLQVPHPRIHRRAFVLVPLFEVWPEAFVPGRGSVADLLAHVDGQSVEAIEA